MVQTQLRNKEGDVIFFNKHNIHTDISVPIKIGKKRSPCFESNLQRRTNTMFVS